MKVYVAVGHGVTPDGKDDPGAVGNGWTEQTAGDHIAARMVDRLRAAGQEAISEAYKRDPNFIGSTSAANRAGVDAVVSIHHDIRVAPEGSFAYHHASSSKGRALAQAIIDAIAADGKPTRRAWLGPGKGFHDGPVAPRGLYILNETRAPATLVEIGPIGHHTLDDASELQRYGDLLAEGVLKWAGIDAPEPTRVHRDVAITAKRDPDIKYARMLADAHDFAYVQPQGSEWLQTYPDGRTTPVDTVDYLGAVGWQSDEIVAKHGNGVALKGKNEDFTRMLVTELMLESDVSRERPWATR